MFALLRQHPVISVGTVLTAILLAWGFWPQPVLVETVTARSGPLTITIEEEGRTRLIDRYIISAPVDGVAHRVPFDVGDPVTQGQALLTIAPLSSKVLDIRSRAQAKARVASAEAALLSAREQVQATAAAAQLAATELQRLKKLIDKELISRDLYDRAVAEANSTAATQRSASFNVDVANHELEAAQTLLKYSANNNDNTPAEQVTVRSPISGKILKIPHECEGPVRTGEQLIEVGDPAALEIEVDVLSTDAVKIRPGIKVLIERWGGERPLQGTVRTVEPIAFTKVSALGVEEQRVLVISDFTSAGKQWRRLGDGYRIEAHFILWHDDSVLQVPTSSLFRQSDGWAVFVAEGNRARRRTVTVGQRNGLAAQILEGVSEGERIINHPGNQLEDGMRIFDRFSNR